MCMKASWGWLSPMVTIISPTWLEVEKAVGLFSIKGLVRIRRKIPATTIVLECSRAETGVGPSIAKGSRGGVQIMPIFLLQQGLGQLEGWLGLKKIKPKSPTRLYRTACIAAVLASARVCH